MAKEGKGTTRTSEQERDTGRISNMARNVFGITYYWQTAAEITDNPRGLKMLVRDWNNKFGEDGEHNVYIISGRKGYRLTREKDEIMESIGKEGSLIKIRQKQFSNRRKRALDFFSNNERLPL